MPQELELGVEQKDDYGDDLTITIETDDVIKPEIVELYNDKQVVCIAEAIHYRY